MVCGLVRTACYPNIYRSASQVRGYFYSLLVSKRIKKFPSPKMRNRQFVFTPKIEYKLVAESAERADKLREANQNSLTFPTWCIYTTTLEPILAKIADPGERYYASCA